MLGILPEERTGELAVRLDASRTVRRLAAEPGDYQAIAAAARQRHRAGTLTLVVLNTVEAARGVYKALRGGPVRVHAAALPVPRRGARAADGRDHRASRKTGSSSRPRWSRPGIDLNASVLVTEAAPWPSLVQRAGRCNRTGLVPDAELWWVPPARPLPYEQADIDAASAELAGLEGRAVTSEDLLSRDVGSPRRRSPCCAGATSSACSTPRRT